MKRSIRWTGIMLLCLMMLLAACSSAPTWQEQYDLGVRYLSEGNYEEAIIAFEAAIEIDGKRVEGYISLANIYVDAGDIKNAKSILEEALEIVDNKDVIIKRMDELGLPHPLEGYPKVTRYDWEDGTYEVWENNEFGNIQKETLYGADGREEYHTDYTYDENQNRVSGIRVGIENFGQGVDKEINYTEVIAYENNGRVKELRRNSDYPDGKELRIIRYTYMEGSPKVSVDYYVSGIVNDALHTVYVMQSEEHSINFAVQEKDENKKLSSYSIYEMNEEEMQSRVTRFNRAGTILEEKDMIW